MADSRALEKEELTVPAHVLRRLAMPAMCWFYSFTPSEYRALKRRDWRALHDFMVAQLERD